ncbi:hypothetical protein Tco_0970102 [Tanacetum coccineum]
MSITGVLGRGWGSPTDWSGIDPRNNGKDRPDQAEDASCSGSTKELRRSEMKADGVRDFTNTFHVYYLKKCYAEEPLVMSLEGILVGDKLQFVEELVEIMKREIKRLKRSRIPLVKVRWNSRRGPEFIPVNEDYSLRSPLAFEGSGMSSTLGLLGTSAVALISVGVSARKSAKTWPFIATLGTTALTASFVAAKYIIRVSPFLGVVRVGNSDTNFFISRNAASAASVHLKSFLVRPYEMVKMTPGYISSGLVQNSVSLTTYVPPSKRDYEILFQPLFDEYFNPPPCAVSPDPVAVAAPRPVDPAGSPLSTTIDQDVPSASTSPTNQEIQFQVTHQGVEEQIHGHQNAQFDNAPLLHNLPSDPSSKETTLQGVIPSNLHHLNQSFDTLTKLTKNHPLENVIGDPSRPVLIRSQLHEHAIWCYFDSNDNPIPFGGKRSG